MRKIRVLVVDDSVVIRRLLTDILSQDPEIEVAGSAPNGRIALQKLTQLNPDLVTLDIEMPEMDGLATLPELRKIFPKLPVIMFSTLTARGAMATLDALARGATDYVTKPANVGSVSAGMQSVRDQLLPKIKALCPFNVATVARAAKPVVRQQFAAPLQPQRPKRACDIIVIGSSTGGPQALGTVLKALPATLPVPIVVVQHMPPVFTLPFGRSTQPGIGTHRQGSARWRDARTGDSLHCAGRSSLGAAPRRNCGQNRFEPRTAGEFLSSGCGCFVPLRGQRLWTGRFGRSAYGNGPGRTAWWGTHRSRRRSDSGSGRSQLRGVGDAASRGRGGTGQPRHPIDVGRQ